MACYGLPLAYLLSHYSHVYPFSTPCTPLVHDYRMARPRLVPITQLQYLSRAPLLSQNWTLAAVVVAFFRYAALITLITSPEYSGPSFIPLPPALENLHPPAHLSKPQRDNTGTGYAHTPALQDTEPML